MPLPPFNDTFPHVSVDVSELNQLRAIRDAAMQLLRCKGRYHSELNYKALAEALGVTSIPDFSPWHERNKTQPILPESQVAGGDILDAVPVLTRWKGQRHPCVGYYIGNNQFQHADGTLEGSVGWGGKVYQGVEWLELPE